MISYAIPRTRGGYFNQPTQVFFSETKILPVASFLQKYSYYKFLSLLQVTSQLFDSPPRLSIDTKNFHRVPYKITTFIPYIHICSSKSTVEHERKTKESRSYWES